MVPYRVNLLIMRLYGVPRCSRFLDELADGGSGQVQRVRCLGERGGLQRRERMFEWQVSDPRGAWQIGEGNRHLHLLGKEH